ncbi:hypothetical protein, partial [Streptomyces endophyticus]|nr:hypothetical protein [Streptomyces endophyticus]
MSLAEALGVSSALRVGALPPDSEADGVAADLVPSATGPAAPPPPSSPPWLVTTYVAAASKVHGLYTAPVVDSDTESPVP